MTAQLLNSRYAEDIKRSFARQSIMQLIGAKLGRIEPGIVEIKLPYRTELTQQNGYLHAGVVTTIADSACGLRLIVLCPLARKC
jgi:acyl-coenzyme A thioesterase PaaI-like protein